MDNTIVDINQYRFLKSLGIMLIRPSAECSGDTSFLRYIIHHDPDLIVCITTPPELHDMYNQLYMMYKNRHIISMDHSNVTMIFSKYQISNRGMMKPDPDTDVNFYNIGVGPGGRGLKLVFVGGTVLSGIYNLSELWFADSDQSNAYFYVDHEYMVAKNLSIIEAGDEAAMRHPDMKLIYYNFKVEEIK